MKESRGCLGRREEERIAKRPYKTSQGNFWERWFFSLLYLWWCFHRCVYVSKFIKWLTLNMCSLLVCQLYLRKLFLKKWLTSFFFSLPFHIWHAGIYLNKYLLTLFCSWTCTQHYKKEKKSSELLEAYFQNKSICRSHVKHY